MQVRSYAPADLTPLAQLFDAYRQFNGQPSDLAAGRAFLQQRVQRAESVILVVEHGGALVGFTQLYPVFSSVLLRRAFVVNDLFVAPSSRRQGAGSALLQAAARYAHQVGAVRITASTAIGNTPTQALNEQNGFARDEAFFVYHRPTDRLQPEPSG